MRLPEAADVMGTAFFVESGSEVYGLSRIANVAVTLLYLVLLGLDTTRHHWQKAGFKMA